MGRKGEIRERKWEERVQLKKGNRKKRCKKRREMRWKEEMRERKPEEKGAMIKEKWKGKVQL